MSRARYRLLLSFSFVLLLFVQPAEATSVLRLNLEQMVDRAGSIFRGTVLDVRSGSIEVGGGQLPTTTYTLRVEERFKGTFEKEAATVEIKNVSTRVGDHEKFSVLPEVPRLSVGADYLLITTAPSPLGLSTTVGLGQGAFSLFTSNREVLAVNAVGNANLGLDGPVAYTDLAGQIRALLGR